MKVFFLMALLIPVSLTAQQDSAKQNCKLIRETDPFTKEIKISSGFIPLDGGSLTIDANAQEIDLLFSLEGPERCFDNNSTAFIYFEGSKTKLTVRNGGTMNCEGLFHFVFRNTPATQTMLNKLATMKVNHFVFTATSKKEITINLAPPDQQVVMAVTQCVADEAKTLIKQ